MKITLVSKDDSWQDEQLIDEVRKFEFEVEFEKIDITSIDNNVIDKFGDVVIWRSSSLVPPARVSLLNMLENRGKVLVNTGTTKFPFISYKLFQQKFVERFLKDVAGIKTFFFVNKEELIRAIKDKQLRFPFIKKPNFGSKGDDIVLINDFDEIDALLKVDSFDKYIFQNFVKNKGDYRVLVLGGKPLGVIKRIAEEGSFLNNVSKGGKAVLEEDKEVKEELFRIATKVASLFELGICGVDIIFDEESKNFRFLEVNTTPQWRGFQATTGINVANKLIKYCGSLVKNNK